MSRSRAAAQDFPAYGFRLGVASVSLRRFSRAEAIKRILELGSPYVSVKEFHLPYEGSPEELERGRKEFEAAGLKIVSGGSIGLRNADEARISRYFEYARMCGMPMIVCQPTQANLKLLEAAVKRYNIQAAIHNHGPQDRYFPTPEAVLRAVKDLDPRVGLCMDLGHSTRAGSDVLKAIAEAGSRLLQLHLNDVRREGEKWTSAAPGEGQIPYPAVFAQLKKIGFRGCANLEYELGSADPLPGMRKALAYLRGLLSG